jgi:hypothetical protein
MFTRGRWRRRVQPLSRLALWRSACPVVPAGGSIGEFHARDDHFSGRCVSVPRLGAVPLAWVKTAETADARHDVHRSSGRIQHMDLFRDSTCAGRAVRALPCEGEHSVECRLWALWRVVSADRQSRGFRPRLLSACMQSAFVPKTSGGDDGTSLEPIAPRDRRPAHRQYTPRDDRVCARTILNSDRPSNSRRRDRHDSVERASWMFTLRASAKAPMRRQRCVRARHPEPEGSCAWIALG